MNNLKKALQNLDFTEEQLSQIRKAVIMDIVSPIDTDSILWADPTKINDGFIGLMKEADEAHLRIEEDKTDPLIGKWLKCVDDWLGESLVLDRWYKVTAVSNTGKIQVNLPRAVYFERKRFDLTDPRDYEPKTVPADILEGLNLLPEDHPEFGNLRKKAIECAERNGCAAYTGYTGNKITDCIGPIIIKTDSDRNFLGKIYEMSKSGAFDPKPVEKRIEFDYERWKKGEYVRLETREGKEVVKLFDFETDKFPLRGLVDGEISTEEWKINGSWENNDEKHRYDLFLVVNE